MTFTLADAEILLGAIATLDRIETTQIRIESDMATFKETVIAAFSFAKARITELELENALLASDDLADEEALAAASEEAALAKAALAEAIAADDAEDGEILAAAADFIVPVPQPVKEV